MKPDSAQTLQTGIETVEAARMDKLLREVPWFGTALYHLFPYRRSVVLGNFRKVFGDTLSDAQIRRLAHAYYAHFVRFAMEYIRVPFMSSERRKTFVRVENKESAIRAYENGKGVLLLTGHFGNWEVATIGGIRQFPQYRNLFYFVRRAIKPRLLNDFITRRFSRVGLGTLPKSGSLDIVLDLLAHGAIIVYVFDQHANKKDGVVVDFFGHPAGTFKSLAILAMSTGAPVIPASSWREPDGTHVLRFEEPLPLIECEDVNEAIRQNTRSYNAALERMLLCHPEQWIWMHRRWKV
jgi:KDO2-lipid IV(A) lauroyltransferase